MSAADSHATDVACRAGEPGGGQPPPFEEAVHQAREVLELERRWRRQFGKIVPHRSLWTMLLEMFVARAEGRTLLTKSLWIGSEISEATVLRRIRVLEDHGHLIRRESSTDRRCQLVSMSNELADRIASFLLESPPAAGWTAIRQRTGLQSDWCEIAGWTE